MFFLRPLRDVDRCHDCFSKTKRKQLFKQFKNWLNSDQFSAASLNLCYRNVSFSNYIFLTFLSQHLV